MEAAADTDDNANNGHCVDEEDGLSVSSPAEGKRPDGAAKQGIFKTFRESIREKKSSFSSNSKGAKVKPSVDMAAAGSDSTIAMTTLHVPPSPSLSTGSAMVSPLKNMGGLFHKKEENGPEGSPPTNKKLLSLSRDDSLMKKAASIRRSLRFGSKKDKEKNIKKSDNQEHLLVVSEGTAEEAKEDVSMWEEIEETYTLPEIPLTPLSVMQINHLIDMEVLEEAYLNLLSMRQEFQQEQGSCGGEEAVSSVELAKKEKDLSLLYGALKDKIKTIVRDSNTLRSRNKELLVHVACVIQEEEKREGDPGGLAAGHGGFWREAWREAVSEGVQAKLGNVPLDTKEQNASWLAVHLGLLGKAILEDLEYVKKDLRWSYPRSFSVFSTYVRCYHRDVGQHLKKLQQQVTELKDYYALLDWIINRYQSERIVGSPSLQPEMESESTCLSLEDGFLDQLKDRYCRRLQEDMNSRLGKMIDLEYEEFWKDRTPLRSNDTSDRPPDNKDNFLCSQFPMDIWTTVKSNLTNSRKMDEQLEMKVGYSCFEELKHFPKRFEAEFRRCCRCGDVPTPLWTEYQIAYINSFITLKEYMDNYRDTSPDQADNFNKEVDWLIGCLGQGLEEQYKNDVKIYQRRMMTRKWLTNDDDFQQLYKRTETLSQNCALMRPPYVQTLVNTLHLHVVKEYVSQLMKNNYSCKNRKHERAAAKIRSQWAKLRELFEDMKSTHEWLHPVGDHLSDIIGERNKRDIKNNLQPLVDHYPDISKKHLAAVLYFRGLVRGRERQLILRKLTELKKDMGNNPDRSRALFSDMHVPANRDCLADIACLSFFLPDNDN